MVAKILHFPARQLPSKKVYEYQKLLRSYRRIAREYHDCQACSAPICPGEMYDAEVHVWCYGKRSGIWVKKQHVECPPDPAQELEDELRREREREETARDDMKMAA